MMELATEELFELAPEAIALSTLDPPRILRVNREFTRLFGYTAEEAVGRSLRELIAPGDLDAGYALNAASITSGRKVEKEVLRQRKDGTRFHAQFTGVRVQLAEGRAGAVLIYRDITEHAQSRALLAGEKQLLEMIARGSPLPAILEAICRLFDELSADGLSSVMLLDPASGRIRPGAAPNLPQGYRQALDAMVFEGPESGPCGLAAFRREPVIVSDLASDARWLDYRELPLAHGLRACWSTPFMSEAGKVLGTFAIFFREPRTPTAQQLGLIEQFAHLASIAVERKLAVEALRISEARYARAMEAADEGHWDWNLASDEIFLSARYRELVGLPADEPFSSRTQFIARLPVIAEDRQRLIDTIQATVRSTAASPRYEIEYRVPSAEGGVRWLRSRGKVFRDELGNTVRMSGSLTDTTERKLAADALRRSEERFALAVEGSHDGIWDWDLVSNTQFYSERAQRICGLEPGATVRTREEWLAAFEFHPDDRDQQRCAIEEHLAGQRPVYEGEWRMRHPDGAFRWVRSRGVCVRDAAGRPTRMAGSIMDVDERKRMEEALRFSEERYSQAIEASEEGHFDWNPRSGEMFVSAHVKKLFGFPPEATIASRSELVSRVPFHPDDVAWLTAMTAEILGGTALRHAFEYRIVLGGAVRWLNARWKIFRDEAGEALRVVGILTDITARKEAESALRESEARFRNLTELSSDFFWETDAQHRYTSIEFGKAYRGVGELESKLGKARWEIPYASPDQAAWEAHRAAIAARQRFGDFVFSRIEQGKERFYEHSGEPRFDAEGGFLGYRGVGRDITERKRVEKSLKESERRFRQLFENSADALFVHDERGRFVDCNVAACRALGYSRQELLERSVADIAARLLSEEKRRALKGETLWERAMQGEPGRIVGFEENELRRKDGTTFPVEVGVGAIDYDGRRLIYASVRDTTERKRVEDELRARQEMLELAQKSARAIAFEWRIGAGQGENRWSSDLEAMYGLAPGTYDGTYESWKKLVHPEDWAAVKEAIQRAQRTGDVAAEYRVIHLDGSVHWLQAKGRMFFDREGKPARMVGFMLDVTQRRQAEEEVLRLERRLRQAQRLEAMGTLAGGIAHDFNNILGAVLGYAEMALRDAPQASRQRRDLDAIMAAGERGRALVDRVLAFSRSGVGERVAVHVEAGVREALDLVAGQLPANVRIETDLRAGRAAMQGDPTQVHQVLMNLATNAVQAMATGGTLRITLEALKLEAPRLATLGSVPAGELIVLTVSDTGNGMTPEVLERIFDPFFTTKDVGVGTGLGLSLVHGIVSEVGGAIDVASTVGEGSVFTVYLPRAGDAVESAQDAEAEMPRGDGQRVLVIDDEEALVRLATQTLADLGYEPLGYTSSAAALEAFRADPQRFDALITDERMPGMTGSALIREVRGIRQGIPIVLMSGFIGGGVLGRAREAGADEVLKKPLKAVDLATSLARVLQA